MEKCQKVEEELVEVKEEIKDVRLDKKLRLKGILKLNERDLSQLNYILTDAVLAE